jgi:hypothetical protein
MPLTPEAFAARWRKSSLKESAAYVEHFTDLCRMLGQKTPAEADPTGSFFTFQKGVVKNPSGATVLEDTLFGTQAVQKKIEHGFADVWFKDHFAWEYKGKHKDLEKAREQLLQYIDDLQNPPLLVVCDFDRFEIHTRFNNCIKTVHSFTNDEIPKPESLSRLRALFENPDFFKPTKTTRTVTEEVAKNFATLATSLRERGVDPHRAAHFLMKLLFCLFAEDVGLLPNNVFTTIIQKAMGRFEGLGAGAEAPAARKKPAKEKQSDEDFLSKHLRALFRAMQKGGEFNLESIDYFDGGLFEDNEVFELTGTDLEVLYYCCTQDWSSVEPTIFGTLFERSLDPDKRSQLGAHYTSKDDIATLVEPVLMQPLRREWEEVQKKVRGMLERRDAASGKEYAKKDKDLRRVLEDFAHRLSLVRVLDPACGSGNFLYVSLNLLKEMEKEVCNLAAKCGHTLFRYVGPEQLYGIEINPYAAELARLVVWIGHIQWDKNNGLYRPEEPILKPLKNIKEMDAILLLSAAKKGKEPVALEPEWPECDVIVGNPPFLGNKRMRGLLGGEYVQALWEVYKERIPASSDLCCYWFEKARRHIESERCARAGLLATTAIKQVGSRRVLERISETGRLFFAVSDRDWVLDGASVRISMVGFGGKSCKDSVYLDGSIVADVNADLTHGSDVTSVNRLEVNHSKCFMGTTKVGAFDIDEETAIRMLCAVNPSPYPNSDVLRPFRNGSDIVRDCSSRWIVDFGSSRTLEDAARFETPFEYLVKFVKSEREANNDKWRSTHWWLLGRTLPDFRAAVARTSRYIGTPRVAKHRVFVWLDTVVLPDSKVIAIARDDDAGFGVMHSHVHELWTLKTCAWHGVGNDVTYNPTTCFETFPFPQPSKEQEKAIALAAQELDELRARWLNPPEWVRQEILEFPGSTAGPWARYVEKPNDKGIGTVKYPRLVPKDETCARDLAKRTLTNLYNERPTWLDLAHKKLDAAVFAAYGWPADLSDDELLARLLKLNQARAAAE